MTLPESFALHRGWAGWHPGDLAALVRSLPLEQREIKLYGQTLVARRRLADPVSRMPHRDCQPSFTILGRRHERPRA